MTPDGVHFPEMPQLRGRPASDDWPAGDPAMAAFAEDLQVIASGPAPLPRPGLVAVMGRGVDVAPGPQPRRSKMLVKTALGSLVAKVALGVGVAAASVTAVGATGVLPDQAQHAVASVVSATTPFVLPDPSTGRSSGSDDPTSSSPSPTSTSTTVAGAGGTAGGVTRTAGGGDPAGAVRADNHGACVSTAAQDKSGTDPHGRTVSSVAGSDCGRTATGPTTSTTVPPTSTTTPTTVAGTNRNANSGPGSVNSKAGTSKAGASNAGDDKESGSGKGDSGGSGGASKG